MKNILMFMMLSGSALFAQTPVFTQMVYLQSKNGVKIDVELRRYCYEKDCPIKDITVRLPGAGYSDNRYDGTVHVVSVVRCPNSQESTQVLKGQRSGSYPVFGEFVFYTNYVNSKCVSELAVYSGNQWIVDPMTGKNNFNINY